MVRVSDLLSVEVLLLVLELHLALAFLQGQTLILSLDLLELLLSLLSHLVLQHASHAVQSQGLVCVGPTGAY